MKLGEKTPKPAIRLVIKLAGSNPRPTNEAIVSEVSRATGYEISPRSVNRICKSNGLPTSSKKPPSEKLASSNGIVKLTLEFNPKRTTDQGEYLYVNSIDFRGGSIRDVQQLLGHESLSTTEGYLAVTGEGLAKTVGLLDNSTHAETGDRARGSVSQSLEKVNDSLIDIRERLQAAEAGDADPGKISLRETAHAHSIRELARALAGKISLPSLWDKDLWRDLPVDFKPGKYPLPIGVAEIDKEKRLKVSCHDPAAGLAAPHLIDGLYSHLATSGPGFAALAGDKGNIQQWVGEVEKYYETALGFLKGIAEKVQGYDAKVNYHDEAIPGLTRWFPITIWSDAIRKAGGCSWIDDAWYQSPELLTGAGLWQLRCGAYIIGIAGSQENLVKFENWHKELRGIYSEDETAKAIAAKSHELENAAKEIRGRLLEFGDAEEIQGRCKLEKNGYDSSRTTVP